MSGALDGLKIADFSWVGAGPRATKDLADNGALVVKIESAKRLDLGRMSPPFARGERKNHDASAFFAQTNTSKKSVTINLSDPRGIEVAKKLVAWADVVVENFGPGFMDRIGLSWEVLQEVKPDIILASVSVAGKTGPMAGFRGYGNAAAAMSGHADMTGWPGSEPHMPPLAYGDVVAPMMLTVAILSALEHRDRTGKGCHVDVSQIEAMVHVAGDLFAEMPADKPANHDPLIAPHGVFPVAGEDAWIAIACEARGSAEALASELGLDEISDEAIAAATRLRDGEDLAQALCDAGVAAAMVLDGKGVSESADLEAASHFVIVDHPVLGRAHMPAPPYQLPLTPWHVGPAPCLGEHNREIFVDTLGMAAEDLAALQEEGVLA
ncbi:benzylsuccinate CoA-transferase BbsF subunit [Pseudooceanicola antarcticus]|uniref:Benzylsuccinate CoA-transferase BbsF subunit n=1 Tax=Pseudooceanicola antarcticus TaxID=1247613 RepID=A0A285IPL8_9RHOB|nr:CoA transferase [Pseudooceanicola antarcticus]PJE31445.1 CoA transferase [Pseudooceanicola antarcticus]SNY49960.1 benzylsuccinate CoA-transferase BbsF subunit [Pseudooceanicola antarcticus]